MYSYKLNGRATGVQTLVKKKTAHADASTNYWTCCENSATNAYNVNLSNGQVNNNNNKNNGNAVRPVAALGYKEYRECRNLPLWSKYLEGWIEAYYDCCHHKMTSEQCTLYRLRMEEDLPVLAAEVLTRKYVPITSICFCVTKPKLREVFAANFRDRIVQHWVCLRLEPMFERRFAETGNVSYNCRKGYGTLAATQKVASMLESITEGYTRTAYVAKFDLHSFFMSIDCNILLSKIIPWIKKEWHFWAGTVYEEDLEDVLWLTEVIIRHNPEKNCERRGVLTLWDKLPKSKSLFNGPDMIGMPIGNLTSQLFANFYLSYFDEWIQSALPEGSRYIRFVDDGVILCHRKEDCVAIWKQATVWLRQNLNVGMHPDKFYIQEASKGIPVFGSIVKPGRIYTGNRLRGNLSNALAKNENLCRKILATYGKDRDLLRELTHSVCSLNSFMGFLVHTNSYGIRRKMYGGLTYFWKVCYISGSHFNVVKIRKKYKL